MFAVITVIGHFGNRDEEAMNQAKNSLLLSKLFLDLWIHHQASR